MNTSESMGLLQQIDKQYNQSDTFWNPVPEDWQEDIQENKIYSGNLNFLKGNSFSKKFCTLTRDRLYYWKNSNQQRSPSYSVIIVWKRVEPFSESGEEDQRYGFRLSRNNLYFDFFTEDADELEIWLTHLSPVAIMSDLENDFILQDEIGKGSYATVYLAKSLENEQLYAIKQIKKEVVSRSSRNIDAIINEIVVMKKLDHPRCVKLHRVYECQDSVSFVLDYLEGGELFKRILRRGKYSEQRASEFVKNMLEVLVYMHSKKIVHRDLKPENILLKDRNNDTEFAIADFGLAVESQADLYLRCGSPGYVAPEILYRTGYSFKIDLFSLGIITYILLSGRAPFSGSTAKEVLMKNRECHLFFHDRYWADVSQEGINFILSLTEPNPENRPSAKEALKHPWLQIQHQVLTPLNLEVPQDAQIPINSPNLNYVSDNFMRKKGPNAVIQSPYIAQLLTGRQQQSEPSTTSQSQNTRAANLFRQLRNESSAIDPRREEAKQPQQNGSLLRKFDI